MGTVASCFFNQTFNFLLLSFLTLRLNLYDLVIRKKIFKLKYGCLCLILWKCQGKHTDGNRPPWPGTIVTICMRIFTTGGPGKEHGTNKPPPTGRVQERSKWDTTCLTTSQNSPIWHPSWLNKACTTRKDSESEWLANNNPETNPITIKPETASHMAELFSWVPSPYCSPPRFPFPIKSLALSAHVSPLTIHFR